MNVEQLTQEFIKFVSVKPIDAEKFFLLYHPVFESTFTLDRDTQEMIEVIPNFDKLIKQFLEIMTKKPSLMLYCMSLRKPYRLSFLEQAARLISISFSKKELTDCVIFAYKTCEFPNYEHYQIGMMSELKGLFELSDTRDMMDDNEKKVYDELPDVVELYRGICSDEYYPAMSWTLDKTQAEWFANRFNRNGKIIEAKVRKEHIYCYQEHEKECIVDYEEVEIL